MRGAREVFYEYISELRGRMDSLVGRDVECTLQQESIMTIRYLMCFEIVLGEADDVSCL